MTGIIRMRGDDQNEQHKFWKRRKDCIEVIYPKGQGAIEIKNRVPRARTGGLIIAGGVIR